ncbi:ParM/StbA family protein [Nostoc flagelliforme FACHB-838]|uniref:ParM/StbA family protein n=1 Tax=Nostoc flagelliforme FACHB-838 TaxID=2692904 RepID=A0ABR8E1M4_9NOSO|nr:ParM/StbA family protein [Nostoc flagelliforme]MBD2535612.1 ParM/StbA family protein [Nostoc flagelliforme FACHB-838]
MMEPYTTLIPQQSLLAYESNAIGISSPEDVAWIEYKEQCWGVGFICQKFYADLKLEKPKLEPAIYKTLAIVGAIAQKKSLANGATIRLGILFPYGEYSDRTLFSQSITDALADFRFRGEQRSFEIDSFVCRPEGFGLLSRGRSNAKSLGERKIAVVMIGYRNASILIMDRGTMTNGISEDLGFHKLVKAVQQRVAGQKALTLASAICDAGSRVNPKALSRLVRVQDPLLQSAELAQIKLAIENSRNEYWLLLSSYLRHHIPSDIDEIIFAGGTSHYLRSDLSRLFPRPEKISCDALEYLVEREFLSSMPKSGLGFRLTDNYGFLSYLCKTSLQVPVNV